MIDPSPRTLHVFIRQLPTLTFYIFFINWTRILLLLKAYAVTAIMKIYAFEIAAGRKVDMLDEVCF